MSSSDLSNNSTLEKYEDGSFPSSARARSGRTRVGCGNKVIFVTTQDNLQFFWEKVAAGFSHCVGVRLKGKS